ncbi:Glycosyl transferase, group 1 family protein [Citrifermentans bremense]|uniref:Glycosyl transferase, group 1 family protein n=1 Tax=Citrifermentans bremense TaxID=60035 RepID=A0A6S6M2Q7_9BACT|nr:glycosyltransferase family 4 protein [Citrifermentans bremense]BCG48632.1 Glycosyl transferase, group 1 family protein [Citrifermentans bremense]
MAERPLRVLVLAPTPFFADRGCHVRILEEARAAMACDVEMRLVTYHIGNDVPGIPTERISGFSWYKKLEAGPSWVKPFLDLQLLFKALKVARQFKPHLIHAHLHEGAFFGAFLKMLIRVPMLFDCQGSLTAEITDHGFVKPGSLLQRFFATLEHWINRSSDFIVTSATPTVDLLLFDGVPKERVRALIDGVDTGVFAPQPKEEIRARLGLPQKRPVVVYLGLMNSYQGVDLLLEAAANLKGQGAKLHYLIMGFPEAAYREKAEEMGVDDIITFTGRIPYSEAPLYLSAGDLAVSPKVSLTEANGKLFNYIACGLPTVVFDTPVNREILGDAALYAKFGDAADLAGAIGRLAGDRELREVLGKEGRERAIALHSWQARGKELVEIYESLRKDI